MKHEEFVDRLKKNGFNFYTGVPCTILGSVISYLSSGKSNDLNYYSATREDEAIGMAVGAYMAGKKPAIFMQNSGLGQSINALVSLALLYKTPFLMIISWRGYQGKDEPEHLYMGQYLTEFLRVMKIPTVIAEEETLAEQITNVSKVMDEQKTPVALILRSNLVL